MKKKNLLVLGALACGLLITSCGDSAEDTTTAYKLTVEKDSGVDSVTFTSDGAEVTNLTSLEEGTELTAKITLKDDYEISAVTLNGSAVNVTGGSYVFDMPATDSTFKVTTKEVAETPEVKTFALTVEKDAGIKAVSVTKDGVALTDLSKVEEGSALVATVTPVDGFTVSAVTLDGVALTLKDGAYAFNMPSKAATLKVTSAEIPPEVSTITVTNDDTKGSYTLTKDGEAVSDGKVNVGDTVKLTVTPIEHFFVKDLTVNGSTVAYPSGGYEFTVTETAYAITINYDVMSSTVSNFAILGDTASSSVGNLTLTANGEEVKKGDEIPFGTEVTVKLSGGYYYESDLPRFYFYVNDEVVYGDDDKVVLNSQERSLTYSFTAETETLEVYVFYNQNKSTSDQGIKINLVDNENIKFYGFEATDLYNGGTGIYIPFTKDVGYVLSGFTGETETGSTVNFEAMRYVDNGDSGFVMLYTSITESITLTPKGEVKDVYNITYVGFDDVEVEGGTLPESVAVGNLVSVQNIYPLDENSSIVDITAIVDGEAVPGFSFSKATSWSGASFNFIMPEGDVEITIDVKQNGSITINENEHIKSAVAKTSFKGEEVTSLTPGTTFYLYIEAEEGYLPTVVKDENGNSYNVIKTTEYDYTTYTQVAVNKATIRMPDDGSDIVLTIETSVAYSISYDESSDYSISLNNSGTAFAAGEEITFSLNPSSGLVSIDDVYLTGDGGTELETEVTLTKNAYGNSYTGKFIMPEQNVKICVDSSKAETYNASIKVEVKDGSEIASVLTRFSLSNSNSNVNISEYEEGLSASFLEGSMTYITLVLAEGYDASAYYVNDDGSETAFDVANFSSSGGSVNVTLSSDKITPNLESIRIELFKSEPLTVGFEDNTNDGLTEDNFIFTVNGEEIETLDKTVYKGSEFGVTVNEETQAPDGFAYIVHLYDTNGEELTANGSTYKIMDDFRIVVEKVQAYKITMVDNVGANISVTLSTADYSQSYRAGDLFFETFTGRIMISGSYSMACDVVITVGDEVVYDDTVEMYGYVQTEPNITFNDDVVITVSAHAE